jgi:hypothetical protein
MPRTVETLRGRSSTGNWRSGRLEWSRGADGDAPIWRLHRTTGDRDGGHQVAGPARDGEAILVADLDLDEIARGKFDLDVVGHRQAGRLHFLRVDRTERNAVEQGHAGAAR